MNESLEGWMAGPRSISCIDLAREALIPGSQEFLNFLPDAQFPRWIDRAAGPLVWDADGREYIDLYCSSGAIILGHANEAQIAAVTDRLRCGSMVSMRHPLELRLATWLRREVFPDGKVMFFKTGSEACQAVVRAALQWSDRRGVVALGYHGWL